MKRCHIYANKVKLGTVFILSREENDDFTYASSYFHNWVKYCPQMSHKNKKKITVRLPDAIYHSLRNQAYEQNISLPDFVRSMVDFVPASGEKELCDQSQRSLSSLPLREILSRTAPLSSSSDERLDFFHG